MPIRARVFEKTQQRGAFLFCLFESLQEDVLFSLFIVAYVTAVNVSLLIGLFQLQQRQHVPGYEEEKSRDYVPDEHEHACVVWRALVDERLVGVEELKGLGDVWCY